MILSEKRAVGFRFFGQLCDLLSLQFPNKLPQICICVVHMDIHSQPGVFLKKKSLIKLVLQTDFFCSSFCFAEQAGMQIRKQDVTEGCCLCPQLKFRSKLLEEFGLL